jgi:hypothetical protein
MADMAARIAAAAGDAAALLSIAIELAQEVAALEQLRAADADRKAGQRERSRRHRSGNVTERDVTSPYVTERDGVLPPPPQVSLLSPTPPNNPSFPPSPSSSSTADEDEFHRETSSPVFLRVATRFLEGKSATARIAWIGRFRGAMARPPHPTAQELADALEDLMANEDPGNWAPSLFRVYVGRIRRDKAREAERDAAQAARPAGTSNGNGSKHDPVADAAWQATLALLPKWIRREIDAPAFAALPAGMRAGISRIGGFQKIAATPDDKRVWLRNDFIAAFRAAPADPVEAASA